MNRLSLFLAGWILSGFATDAPAVDRFNDISVAPESLNSGDTYHGYYEFRVLLENYSLKETHRVTLVYPDQSFDDGNGDSIRRLSRTVVLGPASRAAVPLWQPPLPVNGNAALQVLIDDQAAGAVNLPNARRHATRMGPRFGNPQAPTAILVSRSLDSDEVSKTMQGGGGRTAFSPSMATGAPDAGGRRGLVPSAWSPDRSSSGPQWLDLDYATPTAADHIRIYETAHFSGSGEIILTGVSGTNVGHISMPASGPRSPAGAVREYAFGLTLEPVKTVRLNFGSASPYNLSIDAVELAGPQGSAWAAAARASSDSSAMAPAYGAGVETTEFLRSEVPVSDWSPSWLSYSAFDAIFLSAADFSSMAPAVATALWRYAECGGNLVIVGGGDVPAPWQSSQKTSLEGGARFDVGFGKCFAFEKANVSGLKPSAIKAMMDAARGSARYWQSLPAEDGANADFPVVKNTRIPVRVMVFVMLAFVVAIGPANMIVLSRLKRRTWMLWTVPAISFVTCLIVFTYSMLREGVMPDTRIEGLTLLDQVNRRATSIGLTAFYCPLTPSQGLSFGFDTEVTPLIEMPNFGMGGFEPGTQREMDWTQSQHLQRGWVTARVPAHFHLRKSETRRERLELESTAGKLNVVNGLGASIRSLWLADQSGQIYAASNIVAGQKAALSPSQEIPKVNAQLAAGDFIGKLGDISVANLLSWKAVALASHLAPGTYIAELDENPFLENGLGSKAKSTRTRSRSIVYGILESPRQP